MKDSRRAGTRVVGTVLILLMAMGMIGCKRERGGITLDPEDFRFMDFPNGSSPYATLDELEKAIREQNITAMTMCYTDPFYVTRDGETTMVSHRVASIACAFAFARLDYSTWSIVNTTLSISDTNVSVLCRQRMYLEEQGEWVSGSVVYRMRHVGSKWYIYEEIVADPEHDLSPVGGIKTVGA